MRPEERIAARKRLDAWEPTDLTPEKVTVRCGEILAHLDATDDNEEAHWFEDELAKAVLAEIAAGHANPVELAQATLPLLSSTYIRWYA